MGARSEHRVPRKLKKLICYLKRSKRERKRTYTVCRTDELQHISDVSVRERRKRGEVTVEKKERRRAEREIKGEGRYPHRLARRSIR